MPRGFNELKTEALEFLSDGHGKTSKDLAAHLGISLTLASDCLGGKLFRFTTKAEGRGGILLIDVTLM